MATEIFRINTLKGESLGKMYISQDPKGSKCWVGHAISFDLSTSDLHWTYDNYDQLKTGLIQFFGDPKHLKVEKEQPA